MVCVPLSSPEYVKQRLMLRYLKKDLLAFVSGAGGWCSELANTINDGNSPYGWRYGTGGYRRILAVEWVLPNGDMLKLGPGLLQTTISGEKDQALTFAAS